jgi:hypothetical protein
MLLSVKEAFRLDDAVSALAMSEPLELPTVPLPTPITPALKRERPTSFVALGTLVDDHANWPSLASPAVLLKKYARFVILNNPETS